MRECFEPEVILPTSLPNTTYQGKEGLYGEKSGDYVDEKVDLDVFEYKKEDTRDTQVSTPI